MNSATLIGRRVLLAIPTLLGLITLTFVITRVVPGDPSVALAGPNPSPEQIALIQAQYGFDDSIPVQYWNYLTSIVQLDFGRSIITGNPVMNDLIDRLPATLELITLAIGLALIIGITMGTIAARSAGRFGDRSVRGVSSVLLALPDFWLALILLYFFFFKLGWAPPPIGQHGPADPTPADITGATLFDSVITVNWAAFKPAFSHAFLPVVSLGLVLSAPVARLMRSATLEVLHSDYVSFGRACGLRQRTLVWYALRAALPPVVTFTGIAFSLLLGGAVLIETVFSWGGAAQYAAEAIARQDFDAIQAFVFIAGIGSIVAFLIVDFLYMWIDPRVRL